MSNDFQKEIDFLGIKASPSFVREPEGNGVAERFIRTLKENLLWVRDFETIEELRLALIDFARWYNDNWLVARHCSIDRMPWPSLKTRPGAIRTTFWLAAYSRRFVSTRSIR